MYAISAYWEYILMGIILIPGLIFAAVAQAKVNSAYRKYSKVISNKNIIAKDAARQILDGAGLQEVGIESVSGTLTDHYDPRSNVVRLSEDISNSSSIAALGVAMHEVGHAIQHNKGYFPAKLRTFAVGFCNISSYFLWPLVIIGLVYNFIYIDGVIGTVCLWSGVAFFGIAVLVNLATLPVEYNASNRALKILESTQILDESEMPGCKKVLRAAGLTYVAALIVSILNLLRFVLVFTRKKDWQI